MMGLRQYLAAGAALIVFSLIMSAFFYGRSVGKAGERLKWELANIETLAGTNDGLAKALSEKDAELARQQGLNAELVARIGAQGTRIETRIREVPVEKIIEIDSDCRIDYGLVRLRNGWAAGDRLGQSGTGAPASDLSGGITGPLPGNAGNNQSD